ncbi:hypothetical protein KAFR_0B01600 [Kazachstania africana CBS 2517]|uniref:Uncharacterized protein n=1 Tax=Kazachstania africana (strain ATCC 22294 / BCRC 22015 / CBS 2517 / CECT 1963 / NBRC 1671 / NRRL Y-8276) TaxID=1071382 RepID=H2AQ09_KAZAF|nr:hypothetical protein KAFR_0B01600 [Kazachstania africana CBS 2517]CCF56459.1 hypothetical protein KAFR_0B01600 [Kazachstania africana CBS 2517]
MDANKSNDTNLENVTLPFPEPLRSHPKVQQYLRTKDREPTENNKLVQKVKKWITSRLLKEGLDENSFASRDEKELDTNSRRLSGLEFSPFEINLTEELNNSKKRNNNAEFPFAIEDSDDKSSEDTFLTGHNVTAKNIPRCPLPRPLYSSSPKLNVPGEHKDRIYQNGDIFSKIDGPLDLASVAQLSNYLKNKRVTCQQLRKRLLNVALKKEAESKSINKFLKDLNNWGENSLIKDDSGDTESVLKEINDLFTKDQQLQFEISNKIKDLSKNLEYIALQEGELIKVGKHLVRDHKKYLYIKERKGDNFTQINFLLDKISYSATSYNAIRTCFQDKIRINMRELFQKLSYDYYEHAADLKEASKEAVRHCLAALEANDVENFTPQLEELRRRRVEKLWSTLSPEERANPRKWENIKNGIYDCNDSLLKEIYKSLPVDYTPSPLLLHTEQPSLNFKTGLEDSTTEIFSNDSEYNPLTTNTHFMNNQSLIPGYLVDEQNNADGGSNTISNSPRGVMSYEVPTIPLQFKENKKENELILKKNTVSKEIIDQTDNPHKIHVLKPVPLQIEKDMKQRHVREISGHNNASRHLQKKAEYTFETAELEANVWNGTLNSR